MYYEKYIKIYIIYKKMKAEEIEGELNENEEEEEEI